MKDKNDTPAESTVDIGLATFLLSKESGSGFKSLTQVNSAFQQYVTQANGDAGTANALFARDFHYKGFGVQAPNGQQPAVEQIPGSQQPSMDPSAPQGVDSANIPTSITAALGDGQKAAQSPSVAPPVVASVDTVNAARSMADTAATNALGSTSNMAMGEAGKPVDLKASVARNPFLRLGNVLDQNYESPRTNAIARGSNVSMGNAAPIPANTSINPRAAIASPKFGVAPPADASKEEKQDVLKNLIYPKSFSDDSRPISNTALGKAVRVFSPEVDPGKAAESWTKFEDNAQVAWDSHPTNAAGWADVGQTYAWHAFNTWLFGAPTLARGLYAELGGDPFWTNENNLFYTNPTAFTEAAGVLGDVTGNFFSPGSQAVGIGKGALKLGGKVIKQDLVGGAAAVLETRGISTVANAVNKVNHWNPLNKMMGSAADLLGYQIGKSQVGQFGAQFAESKAGKTLVSSVADVIGKGTMKSLLGGSRSAEATVEKAANNALRETISQEWKAARLSPLRNKMQGKFVTDSNQTSVLTFAANARKQLGKVLGEVDDVTMQNMVNSMTKDYVAYLKANPSAQALMQHPFGAGRIATGLQKHMLLDVATREITNGGLEAVGFGVQHLVASIGPYYEEAVYSQMALDNTGVSSIQDVAMETTKNWLKMNWDPSKEGFVGDSAMMGFVFGTKGLGIGHLKLGKYDMTSRNFANLKAGLEASRGTGKMPIEYMMDQVGTAGHQEVLERVTALLQKEGIPFSPQGQMQAELEKLVKAGHGKAGRKAIEKAVTEVRGNMDAMTDQELAIMGAISRENAARFPIILRDGNKLTNKIDLLRDEDISLLYRSEFKDPLINNARLEIRATIKNMIEHDNAALAGHYAGEARSMFLSDLTKSSIVAGAIFMETGGVQMINAAESRGMKPQEMANIMSHAMFSFMAGSHNRYSQTIPDSIRNDLDTTKMGRDTPTWLQNRVRLSSLQAQLHYGGKDVHPFIQYVRPKVEAHSLHMLAATGAMNDFLAEIHANVTNTVKSGKGFYAVGKSTDSVPENHTPVTQNELDQGLQVLKALVASGIKLPESFNFGGHKPSEGQDYIDFVNNAENRGQYLGHVVQGMRKMAEVRNFLKTGEEFTADTFYRLTRLSAQGRIGEIAKHIDYTATVMARLMKGVVAGKSDVVLPMFLENNPTLTAQVADFVELSSMLQSRYETIGVEASGTTVTTKATGDRMKALLQVGRNALELRGVETATASQAELISAAELALTGAVENFHRAIQKSGVPKELLLGTPSGDFKNNIYNALELTGRSIAGELFHFRREGGVAISGSGGKRLTIDGIIAAAEEAGFFSNDRLAGVDGRRILRPLDREMLKTLSKTDPLEAIRLVWLHDVLSSMHDKVYTVSEETGKNRHGMTVETTDNTGKAALLNPITMSKLVARQPGSSGLRPGEAFNPMHHVRGFWGALEDAGIVVNSRHNANNIISDLAGLRDMSMPESDRMGFAAIKMHKLFVKDSLGNRLIAPQVLIQNTMAFGDPRLQGVEGLMQIIHAMRATHGDIFTQNQGAHTKTIGWGPAEQSIEMLVKKAMADQGIEAGVYKAMSDRDVMGMLFKQQFGVYLNEYIALGDRLTKRGAFEGWATETGKADGKATTIDGRMFDSDGKMPLLQEALDPLSNVTGERRAKMVESMTASIRGFAKPLESKTSKSVEDVVSLLSALGRVGDKTSMAKLRYLTEGVGSITINKDGQPIFTLKTANTSQEAFNKMLDRYEALELGKGNSAEAMNRFAEAVDSSRDSMMGKAFLMKPDHNKGVTFAHLFKEMRVGSTFTDKHMQVFFEMAEAVSKKFGVVGSEKFDMTGFTDELMTQIKAAFRQMGRESIGNRTPDFGPLTKKDAGLAKKQGVDRPILGGPAYDAVERELSKLTRNDVIGLFNEVSDPETVYYLTAANARALEKSGVTLPKKGQAPSGNFEGEENVSNEYVPTGIREGAFDLTRKTRNRGIHRDFLDAVYSELTIELNTHDEVNNTNLMFDLNRLKEIATGLFARGLAADTAGQPNALDTAPNLSDRVARAPGRHGHLGDNTPIVLIPFGDNKLLGVQVPKDRATLLAMMKHTKEVFDSTSSRYDVMKQRFEKVYKAIMDENGIPRFENMKAAIDAGVVKQVDLYNMYATVLRGHVHGYGSRGGKGNETYAMNGAAAVDANKRYTQLASDSYRKINNLTFSMAVNEHLRQAEERGSPVTEADLAAMGIVKKADGTYRIRVQLVDENKGQKRGGVEALDGNISVVPDGMDILAISSGFNPNKSRELGIGDNMQWAGWKGFIFGSQGNGFNFLTKSFMTSMDDTHLALARQSNVAMFVPMSAIKLGKPVAGARYLYNGEPITHVEAAHRLKNGEEVQLIPDHENIIEISPEDLKFQAMHDVNKLTATATAQLTQGMSHEAIKAFLDDDAVFPANDMAEFVAGAFDHSLLGQAELRAFYERDGTVDEKYAPNDYGLGAMSLMDVAQLHNRAGTVSVMFDQQMKQRVVKMAKDRLFKGLSRHGGSAAMAPDTSGDLKTTEVIFGHQARNTLVKISNAFLGVERTRHLTFKLDAKGNVEDITDDIYSPDHASAAQKRTFGWSDRRAQAFNSPSADVPPENVKDRVTTWIDQALTQRFKVDTATGHVSGYLGNVMAEIYGGGLRHQTGARKGQYKNGKNSTHFAPIYDLFNRENGHIAPQDFIPVAEVINNMFVDVITAHDAVGARDAVEAAITKLSKKDGKGVGLINTQGGDVLVRALGEEMLSAVGEAFANAAAKKIADQDMPMTGRGTSASQTTGNVGEITNGDLMGILDSILGYRVDGSERSGHGYDYASRYVTEDGHDLNNGAGLTPVKYGITGAIQRSPSAKVNDTVLFHQMGYMDDRSGGLAIVNRIDAVDAMEADYDYDTFKYMFALPKETLGDVARLRNIIGPLGSQKPSNDTPDYSYMVDSDPYDSKNQNLKYIQGQHKAAALKGQLISAKAVIEKMIADGRGFSYTVGSKTYRVTPKYSIDEMQKGGMYEMEQIYRIVQKVLDTPGSMLPSDFKLLDKTGEPIKDQASLDLNNFDVDKEIFGRLFKKELDIVHGTPILEGSGPDGNRATKRSDTNFDDLDWAVLRSVRGLIGRASAVIRDEHDGDTVSTRNVDDMIRLAREYTEIFGNRLTGQPGPTREDKLREYILRQTPNMGQSDRKILETIRFHTDNPEMQDGYVDKMNQWITRLGDAMNGEIASDPHASASAKLARAVAMRAAGDYALLNTLEAAERIPEIRAEIYRIQQQQADLGPQAGAFLTGQLNDLKFKLEDANKHIKAVGTSMIAPDLKSPEGRVLQRRLTDGTIMGYAMKLTANGISDNLDGRTSALADMAAKSIIAARNQLWGIGMSEVEAPITKAVKPEMIQEVLDAVVANYMRQFSTGSEKVDMFEQLAIRLLTPKANALYAMDGQKFFSYERMNQDIVRALMKYDVNSTRFLLQKINKNALMMSDVFSGNPVIGTMAIREQVEALTSYDGRIGERKTMLRNIFKQIDVENPIQEMMEQNLSVRGMMDTGYDPLWDGVLPGGTNVKGANQMLVNTIRSQASLEEYRGRMVDISLRVDPSSVLDVPGLKEMLGANWDRVRVDTSMPDPSFTTKDMYKKLYEEAVQGIQKDLVPPGMKMDPSKIYLDNTQRQAAVNKANETFSLVMSKVAAASMDYTSKEANKTIIRGSAMDIRRIHNQDIYSEQARREVADTEQKNCTPGGI